MLVVWGVCGWSWGSAGGLVVLGGVEDEFALEFSGGGVDDSDVEVVDEEEDVGSGVGSADADVVEPAVDAQGDNAGVVDAVGADAMVDLAGPVGVGVGVIGGGGGGSVRQGAIWAASWLPMLRPAQSAPAEVLGGSTAR
ncbi:hypothetical protein AB0E63_43105 [Kribbella sp. NPDC026596]|uniref:hypothetical protein n=1 Tax=Kribbella sp. NPDC026596 TaxID=3155122 RepID=UPI0033FDB056